MGGTYDGPHEDDLKAPDLVDPVQVASLRAVYGDDLAAAMAGFVAQVDGRMVALLADAGAGDATAVAGRVHVLAGTCSTLGAAAVAQRCRAVEAALDAGRVDDALALVRDLPDLWQRSASQLTAAAR